MIAHSLRITVMIESCDNNNQEQATLTDQLRDASAPHCSSHDSNYAVEDPNQRH